LGKKDIEFESRIFIDVRKHTSSDWFAEIILAGSIQNPDAREKGYIYYRSIPKINISKDLKNIFTEDSED